MLELAALGHVLLACGSAASIASISRLLSSDK